MKIGIIGAGQIGGTLTRRLTELGHEVFVANSRGPETLSDLAKETGATAVSVPEAVRSVDLVVVTIPEKNIPDLPAGLFADTRSMWSSLILATTTRANATAASKQLRQVYRRASGSSSNSAGQ
jgi:predicted dinucleotide-binding enzyme